MDRRSFLAMLAALSIVGRLVPVKPQFIDWENSCLGTARVFVDGREYGNVARALTGRNGWIEYFVERSDGRLVLAKGGREIARFRANGFVSVQFDQEA